MEKDNCRETRPDAHRQTETDTDRRGLPASRPVDPPGPPASPRLGAVLEQRDGGGGVAADPSRARPSRPARPCVWSGLTLR